MQKKYKLAWMLLGLLTANACAARLEQQSTQVSDRFQALLAEARLKDENDGFDMALPAYLEALASEGSSDRADLLRYQLALRSREMGRDADALDFLQPILERNAAHPLAAPLKSQLVGAEATEDTSPVTATAPAVVAVTTTAVPVDQSELKAGMAWRDRLDQLLGDDARIRILLPNDALAWNVDLPSGAWDGERQVYAPGWSGLLRHIKAATWKNLTRQGGQPVLMKIRNWQGQTRLARTAKGLVIEIPLDDYLIGVVGTEMSPAWHIQALRAQAVASRTYLIYTLLNSNRDGDYDLRGDVMDQAFRPDAGQHSVIAAVRETHGQILVWEDHPARIFFHADNGGISEEPRFVWGFNLPYYRIQNDAFSNKVDAWTARVSVNEICRRLNLPKPSKIRIHRDPSGRAVRLLWTDTAGNTQTIRGNDFRLAIGPRLVRSLLFSVEMRGDDLVFEGRGYGHGVGMSQWGAKTMAEHGMDYAAILQYYYPGTTLRRYSQNNQVNERLSQ